MGSRRSPGRGKSRRRQTPRSPRFRLTLDRIELAAGRDGLLRGGPEPALLGGLFRARPGPVLLGRCLHRLGSIDDFPHNASLDQQLLDVSLPAGTLPGTLALLCLVLEEDSGRDLAQLYADLATPANLAAFDGAARVPEPRPMSELMAHPASELPHAETIHLLRDDQPLQDQVKDDDWIAAALIRIALPEAGRSSHWALQARSADGHNDWTFWLHAWVDA
jgi:hypothetical protein